MMAVPEKSLSPVQVDAFARDIARVAGEHLLGQVMPRISEHETRIGSLEQAQKQEALRRSQAHNLKKLVGKKVYEVLPSSDKTVAKLFAEVWGGLKDKFEVTSYLDIPRCSYEGALKTVAEYDGSGRYWWRG